MEQEKLVVSISPHIRDKATVSRIMWDVIIALIPASLAGIYYFRGGAIGVIIVCVSVAVATEAIVQKLLGREITIKDGSAIITGLLLALNMPPRAPLWLAAIGSIIAIVLVKQLFGGLGYNIFNPALAARAIMLVSWPLRMTTWVPPIDATSTATPLDTVKLYGMQKALELLQVPDVSALHWDLFIGRVGGCIGETSAIAILIGAVYLLIRKVIDWRIPVGFIGVVFILSLILGKDPYLYVFGGGLMLGAFFMATDMVTSPVTKLGRLIFGIGCGIVTILVRVSGSYPEGVSFSILFMNTVTPLLDRYTKPIPYGKKVKSGA